MYSVCEYRVSRIPLEMNSKALSPLLDSFLHLTQTLPRWAMVLVDVIEHGSSHMVLLVVDVIEHGSSHMEGMAPLFARELVALSPLLDSFLHLTQTLPRWAMVLAGMEPCSPLVLVAVVVDDRVKEFEAPTQVQVC